MHMRKHTQAHTRMHTRTHYYTQTYTQNHTKHGQSHKTWPNTHTKDTEHKHDETYDATGSHGKCLIHNWTFIYTILNLYTVHKHPCTLHMKKKKMNRRHFFPCIIKVWNFHFYSHHSLLFISTLYSFFLLLQTFDVQMFFFFNYLFPESRGECNSCYFTGVITLL